MTINQRFWLTMASAFIWVLCYSLWWFFSVEVYYLGQAQLIAVLLWNIHQNSNGKLQRTVSRFFYFIGINNVLDELFFDPLSIDLNEYLLFFTYFIYSLWTLRKR